MYTCPFVCPYCNGFVETRGKLADHIRKSHSVELSVGESVLPSVSSEESSGEFQEVQPSSSTQQEKSDSYIITLNPAGSGTLDNTDVQLISLDKIKKEIDDEEDPLSLFHHVKMECAMNVKEEVDEPDEHISAGDVLDVVINDTDQETKLTLSNSMLDESRTGIDYSYDCETSAYGDSECNKTTQGASEIQMCSVRTYGRRKCIEKVPVIP